MSSSIVHHGQGMTHEEFHTKFQNNVGDALSINTFMSTSSKWNVWYKLTSSEGSKQNVEQQRTIEKLIKKIRKDTHIWFLRLLVARTQWEKRDFFLFWSRKTSILYYCWNNSAVVIVFYHLSVHLYFLVLIDYSAMINEEFIRQEHQLYAIWCVQRIDCTRPISDTSSISQRDRWSAEHAIPICRYSSVECYKWRGRNSLFNGRGFSNSKGWISSWWNMVRVCSTHNWRTQGIGTVAWAHVWAKASTSLTPNLFEMTHHSVLYFTVISKPSMVTVDDLMTVSISMNGPLHLASNTIPPPQSSCCGNDSRQYECYLVSPRKAWSSPSGMW